MHFWYLNSSYNHGVRKCPLIRDQEVGGSNPLAPTNPFNSLQARFNNSTLQTYRGLLKLEDSKAAELSTGQGSVQLLWVNLIQS